MFIAIQIIKIWEITNSKLPGHFYKIKKTPPGWKFLIKKEDTCEWKKNGRVVTLNQFYLLKKTWTFSSVSLSFYQIAETFNSDIMLTAFIFL